MKKVVGFKHKELTQVNYGNLNLLREINRHKKNIGKVILKMNTLDQNEKKIPIHQTPMNKSSEDNHLLSQIDHIKQSNKLLKHQIYTNSNNYF